MIVTMAMIMWMMATVIVLEIFSIMLFVIKLFMENSRFVEFPSFWVAGFGCIFLVCITCMGSTCGLDLLSRGHRTDFILFPT